MAKTTEQKIEDRLYECYAKEGTIKRLLEKLRNQLDSDDITPFEKDNIEKQIMAQEVLLENVENEILG